MLRSGSSGFRFMLGALIVLLALPTLLRYAGIETTGSVASFVMGTGFIVLLLSALPVVGATRKNLAVTAGVIALVLALRTIDLWVDSRGVAVAYQLLMLGFMSYLVIVTLRFLLTTSRVTSNMISGAVSAYLLLGVIFAFAYSLVDILEPGSFRSPLFEEGAAFMHLADGGAFYPFYYSLVTLTTLGYGDIIPVTRAASMLAALEALMGQIYLAVLVARLVGLQVAQAAQGRSEN